MSHLAKSMQKFWKRWKRKYLLELRKHHCTQLDRGEVHNLKKGEVVTMYDKGHPRGLWRLGRIQELIEGAGGRIRRVYVRVMSKQGQTKVLRRPVQHTHPLEVHCRAQDESTDLSPPGSDPNSQA